MDIDTDGDVSSDRSLDLDPFGFIPEAQSRIPGLGGPMPPINPTYAFHTPYVAIARGTVNFNVHFENLKARRGTLTLRVHMLPDEPGSIARLVNSERIQLNRLVAEGGNISISAEGFRGVTYALVGAIPDDTDVSADGLTIQLDRRPDQQDPRAAMIEARTTAFGNDRLKPSPHLLSMDEPRFEEPVSQPFTPQQLEEPAFAERIAPIDDLALSDTIRWEAAYVMQILGRYGMLAAGAQGLCLPSGATPIPALVASMGPSVRVGVRRDESDPEQTSSAYHDYRFLPRGEAADRLTIEDVEPFDCPPHLVNLDFLWTEHLCDRLAVPHMIAFLDEIIDRLRPGGFCVHLFAADMAVSGRGQQTEQGWVCGRADIEQIALTLISRGHEVARVRPGRPQRDGGQSMIDPAPFALVVRRTRSTL